MAETSLLYRCAQFVTGTYFELLHQVELHGLENVPASGGFLLASNHASHYDPPLVGFGLPRTISYFARRTLLDSRIGAWLLPRLNTIPVDRDGPGDVAALRRVLAMIAKGHGVIVFPEGTRSANGQLQEPKAGVGFLACRAGVPVLPVRVFGTYEAFGRQRKLPRLGVPLAVVYGPLIWPAQFDPGDADKGTRYQEAARRILAAIAAIEHPRKRLP